MIGRFKHFAERHLTSIEGNLVKALIEKKHSFLVSDFGNNRGFRNWLYKSIGDKIRDVQVSDLGWCCEKDSRDPYCWCARVIPKGAKINRVTSCLTPYRGFKEEGLVHDLHILFPIDENWEKEFKQLCETDEPFLAYSPCVDLQETLQGVLDRCVIDYKITPVEVCHGANGLVAHTVQLSPRESKRGIIPEDLL